MMDVMQYLAPLGVGGVLAAFIFMAYRKDSKKAENEKMDIVAEYAKRLEHQVNNQRMDRQILIETLDKVNSNLATANELHRNLSNDMRDLVRTIGNNYQR